MHEKEWKDNVERPVCQSSWPDLLPCTCLAVTKAWQRQSDALQAGSTPAAQAELGTVEKCSFKQLFKKKNNLVTFYHFKYSRKLSLSERKKKLVARVWLSHFFSEKKKGKLWAKLAEASPISSLAQEKAARVCLSSQSSICLFLEETLNLFHPIYMTAWTNDSTWDSTEFSVSKAK